MVKYHWFYRSGNRKGENNIGFEYQATENVEMSLEICVKVVAGISGVLQNVNISLVLAMFVLIRKV